jgi:hypothetical protein
MAKNNKWYQAYVIWNNYGYNEAPIGPPRRKEHLAQEDIETRRKTGPLPHFTDSRGRQFEVRCIWPVEKNQWWKKPLIDQIRDGDASR